MKRAKFETPDEQRNFFIDVKKKLGIGSKNLSKKLGLKSRGGLESYTLVRTSPPIEIVKRLEKISGIKARYEIVDGKIYRKKREFMPADPKISGEMLKKLFGKDFDYLSCLIKSKLSISDICKKMRSKNYSFDGSKVNRYIGAYRKNLLSQIIKKIKPNSEEIVVRGFVNRGKGTLEISFNLGPLYNLLKKDPINLGLEISEDRKNIRIMPLGYGRKPILSRGTIKFLLTEKSGFEIKENVSIILDPRKFGLNKIDTIYDLDAKGLYRQALENGFILDSFRSTPFNHKGDLSLFKHDKNLIIEITRASSPKTGYFKVGQCFIQKISWPDSIQILICKKQLLTKDSISALDKIGVRKIFSDFGQNWEQKVINELNHNIKNGN